MLGGIDRPNTASNKENLRLEKNGWLVYIFHQKSVLPMTRGGHANPVDQNVFHFGKSIAPEMSVFAHVYPTFIPIIPLLL